MYCTEEGAAALDSVAQPCAAGKVTTTNASKRPVSLGCVPHTGDCVAVLRADRGQCPLGMHLLPRGDLLRRFGLGHGRRVRELRR